MTPAITPELRERAGKDRPLAVLDLFSGIGGFSLGLERSGGFKTVAFCEIEPFCRRVLAKHWPEVPCYDDVRTLTADRLRADGIAVDVICGGFPCQDISLAGKGEGLAGARSGLWSEIARLAGELRPLFLIVENVSALLSRGLGTVLGDLASLGLDAEWHCIPASAIGAPHQRDRFWLVAYPQCERPAVGAEGSRSAQSVRDFDGHCAGGASGRTVFKSGIGWGRAALADAHGSRLQVTGPVSNGANGQFGGRMPATGGWWSVEPDVDRVAHGVPGRVDRLRALGNAVVPQIPELIGRAILANNDAPPASPLATGEAASRKILSGQNMSLSTLEGQSANGKAPKREPAKRFADAVTPSSNPIPHGKRDGGGL